jgi:hypothetical protein
VSVYSLSLSSGTTTTASPAFDLQGEGASPKILEVSVTCGSAAAGAAFGLGRAGNGSSPIQLAPIYLLSEADTSSSLTTSCATAWTVAPTIPAQMFRRNVSNATVGGGVIWTFPRGLRVENGTSMVLWNILTNSPLFFATWIIDD